MWLVDVSWIYSRDIDRLSGKFRNPAMVFFSAWNNQLRTGKVGVSPHLPKGKEVNIPPLARRY
jgi:hypothetical protein